MPYHHQLEEKLKEFRLDPEKMDASFTRFLDELNSILISTEEEKRNSAFSAKVNEKEFREILQNQQTQHEIIYQSIQKLKKAITSLDPDATLTFNESDDELIGIVSYLEELIGKSKKLEQELIHSKEVAEKASRAKTEFLSVMSHEIRTPLNAIIGIAHLLKSDELPPSQAENLQTLNISAENLLCLINDVLDFSKIEEGKIVLSEKNVDLRNLVTNIKMANRIRADQKGNTIKVLIDQDLPRYVIGDDIRLGQILNNLVSNAVKFTRNGTITIEVSANKITEKDVEVYFSVTDTGIGIEKEKQSLIFDQFAQANTDITREFGGSGLGLAIIKRLILLHKSEIHLQSDPGNGSKFYFTINYKKGKEEPGLMRPVYGDSQENLSGMRILLVEDVEFNVLVAEKMLSNWNAKVDVAENGLLAVGKVRENEYDLILMDLQMPVLDGYSATRHIREFNKDVPIIALTASASIDIQQKTKESGMDGYLSKPFKPNDLFDAIYKYINRLNKAS